MDRCYILTCTHTLGITLTVNRKLLSEHATLGYDLYDTEMSLVYRLQC